MFVLTLTDKCNAYRFKYDNFCHFNFIYATFCIHIIVSILTVKYQKKNSCFSSKKLLFISCKLNITIILKYKIFINNFNSIAKRNSNSFNICNVNST